MIISWTKKGKGKDHNERNDILIIFDGSCAICNNVYKIITKCVSVKEKRIYGGLIDKLVIYEAYKLHLKGNNSSTQTKTTLDGFHCILLLYTAPMVCTQNWRSIKQNFYNLIFETSFWSMNEKAAFHLSLFTPQEHDIEWCIPKRGNDLKEVKVSFSLSYWMIMVIICCRILLWPYLIFKEWTVKMYCAAWYWRHVYCFIAVHVKKCNLFMVRHPKMSGTRPTVSSKFKLMQMAK